LSFPRRRESSEPAKRGNAKKINPLSISPLSKGGEAETIQILLPSLRGGARRAEGCIEGSNYEKILKLKRKK